LIHRGFRLFLFSAFSAVTVRRFFYIDLLKALHFKFFDQNIQLTKVSKKKGFCKQNAVVCKQVQIKSKKAC